MSVIGLNHYNVLTLDIEESIRFYRDGLGLRAGPAPGRTASEGAWIYDPNNVPVVHLQGVDPANPALRLGEVKGRLGDLWAIRDAEELRGSAAIEHIAFNCCDYEKMRSRLTDAGLSLRESFVEAAGLRQIFVSDPNGIIIELNFLE